MAKMMRYSGGGINSLTNETILRGYGENITNIDYNNIKNNRLIFIGPELIIKNTNIEDENNLTCNIVRFNTDLYYDRKHIDANIQLKLIPNLGIRISNNTNISVNFSDGGWTSNTDILYTNNNNTRIGIGITNPSATLHIKNDNASIIIENNNNLFKFYYDNNTFIFGTNNSQQFKIHKDAKNNSINIDNTSTVNIGCNLNVNGNTNLTSNIYINAGGITKDIISWLKVDNQIADQKYVSENLSLTDTTTLKGIGSTITKLDYKNITLNKLIFLDPLIYDDTNNTIDINLSKSGWTNRNNSIYSPINSNVGIGTSRPLGLLHIGSTSDNIDGTIVISRTVISDSKNKNFKLGYDDKYNFVFGNLTNNNIWSKQFYINPDAPGESLIITNLGNININSNLLIKNSLIFNRNTQDYNLNIDSSNNFNIANNIIINRNGLIGIGISPIIDNTNSKLYINGNVKILSDLYTTDIYANDGSFNFLTTSNLNILNNLNVLLNITTNTINTQLLSSANINANNINATRNINTLSIYSSNSIYTNIFDTNDIICSNNIISIKNINGNIINAKNIISDNIKTLYNITSRNINITNDLKSLANIYANLLIYSSNNIIAKNNIYSKNIESETIKSTISITAETLNSITINNEENITTKDLSSTNIISTNIDANLISARNITVDEQITVNNINSLNINNNETISTYNLNTINNITCQNAITANTLDSILINSDIIGINTDNPKAELHILHNTSFDDDTSIIITNKNNDTNFKIGFTDNNFCIGTYNSFIWKKQISINVNTDEDNIINIKSSGNIAIGTEIQETADIYKLNIIGYLNATEIYENGIKILNNTSINTIINNKLESYLSITDANNIYSTKISVNSHINDAINKTENFVTSLLSFNSNIFSNEKRYPYANNIPTREIYDNIDYETTIREHNQYIYAFKDGFSETFINIDNSIIERKYIIYYSSIETVNTNSRLLNLFYYNDVPNIRLNPSWGLNNYKNNRYYTTSANILIQDRNSIIYNSGITLSERYYGDFIIIKFTNFNFIFSKFRFYILNTQIYNAPSEWRCYASNDDGENWIILEEASNDNNDTSPLLKTTDYIKIDDKYSYYEKNFYNDTKYNLIGFVFNKVIYSKETYKILINLKLFKLELYGKEALKPLYISSNVLDNILTNYVKNDSISTNIQGKLHVTSPLELDVNNNLSFNATTLLNIQQGIPQEIYQTLKNSIEAYIESKTDIWIKEQTNIYYNSGIVGIGTNLPNINNDTQLKLNVGGNIVASNINVINNINSGNTITAKNLNVTTTITATNYQGNGSLLTNINYNNIPNKPDLINLNNWNISINPANNITNCYNILNGNIGIGYTLNAPLISKLSVNGNIFSSANINCTNLQENSINISDKYISITNAFNTYLSKSGGIISGSIGIGTTNSDLYRLNINGTINTTSINSISFIENGIDISNKYLTILNANSEYLSKNTGGTINNNLIISQNLAIGSTNITDYRLNVNGSIYSSNNISCLNNIIEGGSNLIDKYLTIVNASNSYLSINGGSILGSIGIGTTNSDLYKLNINGSLNTTSLYINNNIIDFASLITTSSLNTSLLLYTPLSHLSDYILNNDFNSTLLLYSKTGEDANYFKITGGTISGDTTFSKNLITSNLTTSNLTSLNQIITSNLTSLNQIITSNLTTSNLTSLNQIITSNIQTNTLITSGKVSIGSITLSDHLLFINGSLNASSLYINNELIDFSSFATNASLSLYTPLSHLSDYISNNDFNSTLLLYSKTGEDTNYLKISGGIIINDTTFSKNLFTSNLISSNIINYSNIQTNTLITSGKVSIGSTTLSDHLLFINGSLNTTSLYINNELIDFSSFATNASLSLYTPLSHLSDYILNNDFNSTLLLYSKTGEDANYFKITGGTISGDTTFSKNLITSNLTTSNLTSLNQIITSNLTSLNQIITSNIITNNLNSSNISNVNLLSSHSIYAINNIGIGTNPTSLYKLNVNGSIYSSNNISCLGNIIENGLNLSDKYLTIENALNNYFLISGGIINNNLGIGTTASQLYKLNVNGSIYSSNNISCLGNIIENGSNLSDKYLTISNASNNYFPINGGSILNNVSILSNLGIGVIANNIYKLTIRGGDIYISNNILCLGNISENGINLNNKYLSINGGHISSNLTISSNVGIGTIANNLYKLNVSGSIYSSNDIICNGIIKEGGSNLNDKYLSIKGGIISSNLIIDSNLSIGTNINNLYKLNVNGSIYSSNDIICEGNIKEGGSNLIDKYLSISDVGNYINTDVLRNELASNQPNIQKKYGFRCICSNVIMLNTETYYKHDIYLPTYVKTKIDSIDANPYRIFGIKFFSTSAIFNNNIVNKPPTILQYDIYTSYIINSGIINICAIGFPSNYYLNKITAGDIFLLKTTNYNYISILSKKKDLNVSCIISDFLF